jgi:hypothetical protein
LAEPKGAGEVVWIISLNSNFEAKAEGVDDAVVCKGPFWGEGRFGHVMIVQ